MNINIVTEDPLLEEQLRFESQKYKEAKIRFSEIPQTSAKPDVIVQPAWRLDEVLETDEFSCDLFAVFAYGDRKYLKTAFLAGCHDFLKDPWTVEELLFRSQRVKTFGEIKSTWGKVSYSQSDICSDFGVFQLRYGEYVILDLLVKNAGQVVTRKALIYSLWGSYSKTTRVVDVYIASLRKKLAGIRPACSKDLDILTVRNLGYRLEV